jgi:hypothetical protein
LNETETTSLLSSSSSNNSSSSPAPLPSLSTRILRAAREAANASSSNSGSSSSSSSTFADSLASPLRMLRDHRGSSSTGSQSSTESNARTLERLSKETAATTEGGGGGGASLKEKEKDVVQIGTVLEIVNWPGDSILGTGRLIRWEGNLGDDSSSSASASSAEEEKKEEVVRWGAENGKYDVTHVAMKNGKITLKYPSPLTSWQRLSVKGFGNEASYSVILRVRHKISCLKVGSSFSCFLEWSDFHSIIEGKGQVLGNGDLMIIEERLFRGPKHTGWEGRFGTPYYQSGTTLMLKPSSHNSNGGSFFHNGDISSLFSSSSLSFYGSYHYATKLPLPFQKSLTITGSLSLQSNHLFEFDNRYHPASISLSYDKLSISKNNAGGGSQGCCIGSTGFSWGVHFWEFKIEQAEIGSVFIGIIEKPTDVKNFRLSRWQGIGFINDRSAIKTPTSMNSFNERIQVYGDHFRSGGTSRLT